MIAVRNACLTCPGDAPDAPSLATLRAFLAVTLARHKLPDELCVIDAVPRTKIGKVDRAALRAEVLNGGRRRERWRPS